MLKEPWAPTLTVYVVPEENQRLHGSEIRIQELECKVHRPLLHFVGQPWFSIGHQLRAWECRSQVPKLVINFHKQPPSLLQSYLSIPAGR